MVAVDSARCPTPIHILTASTSRQIAHVGESRVGRVYKADIGMPGELRITMFRPDERPPRPLGRLAQRT